jgi:hypothetical protein
MKNIYFLYLLIFSLSALGTDFPDGEFPWIFKSDSQIRGPAYAKIVEDLEELEANHPDYAQVINYGVTPQGRNLVLIKISKKDLRPSSSKPIYIGGSIHGDEYLNIEDRLPRWFLEQGLHIDDIKNFLDEGGIIYIAPILNPDGGSGGVS